VSRSLRTRARAAATTAALVAATAAGTALPLTLATPAAAASCAAPTGLTADDALRGAATQIKDVRLTWTPVSGAARYQVEVSPNEDFTNNVYVNTTTISTRYDVPQTVLKPSAYFWRVRVAGASCWSDDSSHAPQFAVAWREAPSPLGPNVATPADSLRFSWAPIPEASSYELEVIDRLGHLAGRCYTTHTSYTPYDLSVVSPTPERLSGNTDCFGPGALGYRIGYVWRVRGIDATGVPVDGKPYPPVSAGFSPGRPVSGQHGVVTVTSVSTPDPTQEPVASAGTTVAVVGTGFAGGATVTVGGVAGTSVNVTDANHLTFTMPGLVPGGAADVVVDVTGSGTSAPSASSKLLSMGEVTLPGAETFAGATVGPYSVPLTFSVQDAAGLSGTPAAVDASTLSAHASALSGGTGNNCATECADTPTLTWGAAAGAAAYRVYLYEDQDLTSLVRAYDTTGTSLTPREALLDNQAGRSYWWVVQSCSGNSCQATSAPSTFRKRSTPIATSSPANGSTVLFDNVVLTWAHWQVTNGTGLAAASYRVQVSRECTFADPLVDDQTVDAPEFVNSDKVYDDGTYYWRVQPIDASGNPLTYDSPHRDTNSCSDVRSFTLHKELAGASNPSGTASGGAAGTVGSAAPRTVDSADRSVRRFGSWTDRKANGARGGKALVAAGTRRERLTRSFTGRSITVGYCTGPMDGGMAVYVDGKLKRSFSTWGPFTRCGKSSFTAGALRPGTHTVDIRATGLAGRGKGRQIAADYLRYS